MYAKPAICVGNTRCFRRKQLSQIKIPGGYSVPVVYGEGDKVRLQIANIEGLSEQTTCKAYHPGVEIPTVLNLSKVDNYWYVDVPLKRGCAMQKITV